MGIYRVFAGSDGESPMEELRLEEHPALGALTHMHEVRVQQFDGTRTMDFHPLPERRLIIHLSGEVEIGTSDGSRQVFRAGDMRLMEEVTGRGHTHVDHSPSAAVYVLLKDEAGGERGRLVPLAVTQIAHNTAQQHREGASYESLESRRRDALVDSRQ